MDMEDIKMIKCVEEVDIGVKKWLKIEIRFLICGMNNSVIR